MSAASPSTTDHAPTAGALRSWRPDVRTLAPLAGLIGVCTYFAVASPAFLTIANLRSLLIAATPLAIAAAALTMIILVGEIDLSTGPAAALASIAFALLLQGGASLASALALTLFLGATVGAINGILTVYGGIPSFIATLGMFSIADGLGYLFSGRSTVSITNLTFFAVFYDARPLGIPIPGLYAIVTLAAVGIMLRYSRFGRGIYAVGGNPEAATMSGISARRTKLMAFILGGVLISLSGLMLAARLASGKPDAAPLLTLDAIAAVIIGGTSLLGGRGSVARTILGIALISVLTNGFGLLNVDTNLQFTIKGVIVVVAVLIDRWGGESR